MKIICLVFIFILTLNTYAQHVDRKDLKYQPKNIEEALSQLDIIYADTTKERIRNLTEDEFLNLTHFSTGLMIRNNWLYNRWFGVAVSESELKKELIANGLFDNDDMSAFILTSYYRHLNGLSLELDKHIMGIKQSRSDIINGYVYGIFFNPANNSFNQPHLIVCNDSVKESFYLNGMLIDKDAFINLQLKPRDLRNDSTNWFNRNGSRSGHGTYEYRYKKDENRTCANHIDYRTETRLPIILNGTELSMAKQEELSQIPPDEILSIERKGSLFGRGEIHIRTKAEE